MKLVDVLTPGLTHCGLPGSSKKRVLENLSVLISEQLGGDSEQQEVLFSNLVAREQLGSTGIGEGVAIPHCRLPGIHRIYCCLAKLEKPIAFDALDDMPVDLIFALLVPEEKNEEHLTTLSAIASLVQHQKVREQLRCCHSAEKLYQTAVELERHGAL